MKQYHVTGMSCAACASRVEKTVTAVPGVTACSVSLLTNAMGVEGTASEDEIISAVENAGYGASVIGEKVSESITKQEEALQDKETPLLKKRLILSVALLIPLMYISMGHMMWGWPLPAFFDDNHVAMGLAQMLFSLTILIVNRKFFISGAKALCHKAPNMDTLVALGSGVSFIWSVGVLFAMTRAVTDGDTQMVSKLMMSFYFESAAMILTLITVGKMLEAKAKGKTTDALKGLMKLAPQTATVLLDGIESEVPIGSVKKGDVFAVKPGESIPVDGIVLEGMSAVNEAALTGESIPVDKKAGDTVSAATVNQSGYLRCRATRVGEDTTLSQIIKMVSDAAATKAPIAKIADRVSGVFVPAVISIAVVTLLIWLIIGQSFGYALARGISVLVISCPCALGLATPVAIMVGNGVGARNGILFKTAVSLEQAGKIDVIALDKTGTITLGEPKVTDILPIGIERKQLLAIAASVEQRSEHPLAKAIIQKAEEMHIKVPEASDFSALVGSGVRAVCSGREIFGGSLAFIESKTSVSPQTLEESRRLSDEGKTPLLFMEDGILCGIIAVADIIKEESPQAIRELKNMGIRTVMLTGDNERTAKAIGAFAEVDEVIAGVLPEGKEAVIRDLGRYGKVAMVGDGINDAPALTRADIGIAIGAGTDVAIDAADIVLMNSKLTDVSAAIRLSRATLRNIYENLFWAFFYNTIGIPLAAGAFISLFGWELNPMFGAAAMSLSSFCVVSNALRLNLFKLYDASRDRAKRKRKISDSEEACPVAIKNEMIKEDIPMETKKTLTYEMQIEGMMCPHCEARVKKALEAIPEVENAAPDHTKNIAVVTLSSAVEESALKEAVEASGYEVKAITLQNKSDIPEVITMNVEGMMCPHCEANVKKALEAIPNVKEAVANHEQNSVKVTLSGPVDKNSLITAVEEKGYTVKGIR